MPITRHEDCDRHLLYHSKQFSIIPQCCHLLLSSTAHLQFCLRAQVSVISEKKNAGDLLLLAIKLDIYPSTFPLISYFFFFFFFLAVIDKLLPYSMAVKSLELLGTELVKHLSEIQVRNGSIWIILIPPQ